MRIINNIADAQKVLNQLLDWKSKQETKDQNLNGLKITNASPGVNPNDYATISQLPQIPDIPSQRDQDFTVIFSESGTPTAGDIFPDYVFGPDRIGYVTAVWVRAQTSPSTGNFTVQILKNGTNIMVTDPTLNTSQSTAFFSNFISPVPSFGKGDVLGCKITSVGNAAIVSVGICIRRVFKTKS